MRTAGQRSAHCEQLCGYEVTNMFSVHALQGSTMSFELVNEGTERRGGGNYIVFE